jgi:hypothetical protein
VENYLKDGGFTFIFCALGKSRSRNDITNKCEQSQAREGNKNCQVPVPIR